MKDYHNYITGKLMNKEENKKSINTGSGGPVRQMH